MKTENKLLLTFELDGSKNIDIANEQLCLIEQELKDQFKDFVFIHNLKVKNVRWVGDTNPI